MSARVCLVMIVKDEAPIIERCLTAVAPWIDSYSILDTGSTDGTTDLIAKTMAEAGVLGQVVSGEFHDFAQARNDALAATHGTAADYLLLCDADMELVVEDPTWRDHLTADAYMVTQTTGDTSYQNLRVVRAGLPAAYVGVTHEYLDVTGTREHLAWVSFIDHANGSSRAGKYERDLALLTAALETDPHNARYVFYIAQTRRDLGALDAALATYERRAAMGGWDEEVWYSLFQVAVLTERLGRDPVAAYLAAYQERPTRAEPLVELARYYREHGHQHHLAHLFATRALEIPVSCDSLFVDTSAYGWRVLDELAIADYWTGAHSDSAAHARAALARPDLPEEHRARIEQNLGFALSDRVA